MSKNKVERTEGSHVVTCEADSSVELKKGEAIIFNGVYKVTKLPDQNTPSQGVTLKAHASGVEESIPVLIPGPVLNIDASGVLPGNLVAGDASVQGQWIVDTDDPAGFALNGTDSSDEEVDICYIGEQN